MDASKVTICWPNRTDEGTLSGGSWAAGFPLNNLKDTIFKRKARSTAATGVTCSLALPYYARIGVIALAAHNLTSTSTWRVRVYYDLAQTDLMHDSGVISVWPAVYLPEQMEWEDENFWTGTPRADQIKFFTPLAIHFLPDAVSARSIRIDLNDADNPAGYVEIGRLFTGDAWQPGVNMSYGHQHGYTDETAQSRALDGTKYFEPRVPERYFKCALNYLEPEEAYNQILLMQRQLGRSGEVLVASDLQPGVLAFAKSFIGTLADMNPILNPYLDTYSNEFMVAEKL